MFYGLSVIDLRCLAYEYAKANLKTVPKSWEHNKMAGKDWAISFRERQGISIRLPENTSIARATAFNRTNVNLFFDALDQAFALGLFSASTVWNLDETGVTTVTKPPRVLSARGERQVGAIASAERGILLTVCVAVNAAGRVLPPAIIYPRRNIQPHWSINAFPDSLIIAQPTGWQTNETFRQVLIHFMNESGVTPDRPHILIFDNHCSHVSLDVVTLARERGLIIVTLPAHCSHKMQPLDVSCMGPFKTYFADAVRSWHQANPARTLSIHDVGPLISGAFGKAFTIPTIINGFKKTGIWPRDRHVFSDDDFSPAQPTDIALESQSGAASTSTSVITDDARLVSPQELRPLPKLVRSAPRERSRSNRRRPVVLTSSPVKEQMELAAKDKPISNMSASDEGVPVVPEATEEHAELHDDPRLADFAPARIKTGDFLLVSVRGGRRNAQTFRYVAQALESYDPADPYWLRVQGYRSMDSSKTKFLVSENDVFAVNMNDILSGLQAPTLQPGRAICYAFSGPLDILEA